MANASDVSVTLKTEKPDVIPEKDQKVNNNIETKTSSKTDFCEIQCNENEVTESRKENTATLSRKETQPECSSKSNSVTDDKCHSNITNTQTDPKVNAHETSLPFNSETFTVTSDSQIWLECCQYNNTFRAYGGNFRNFHPNSSKLCNNQVTSSNHHYSSQGTSSCPPIHRGNNSNSMNYNRNTQYVVHLHVNPGETISFDMGDHVQLIQGI